MERLFLIHDEASRQSMVRDYLELGGYEIIEGKSQNPESNRYAFQLTKAVVLECNESINYIQVCRKIRRLTNKPIIILSNSGEEWEKVKMFQSGADDFLVSPYPQTELMARIRAHIDCYKRLTQSFGEIKIKNMVIDALTRRVYIDDELIPLRLKEFDILLYLAQHQDRIVTKEELYHVVWRTNDNISNYENTVAVHIKRIREKIETDIGNPQYVETVWGVGYRFVGLYSE